MRHDAEELNEKRNVVFFTSVFLRGLRVKEIVGRDQFEDHACHRPDVHGRVVRCADDSLRGPVLPCLHVVRGVLLDPAGGAQASDLEREALVVREASALGGVI